MPAGLAWSMAAAKRKAAVIWKYCRGANFEAGRSTKKPRRSEAFDNQGLTPISSDYRQLAGRYFARIVPVHTHVTMPVAGTPVPVRTRVPALGISAVAVAVTTPTVAEV